MADRSQAAAKIRQGAEALRREANIPCDGPGWLSHFTLLIRAPTEHSKLICLEVELEVNLAITKSSQTSSHWTSSQASPPTVQVQRCTNMTCVQVI